MINSYSNTISKLNLAHTHKCASLNSKFLKKSILIKVYKLNLIQGYKDAGVSVEILFSTTNQYNFKFKNYYKANSKIYFSKNQILKKKIHLFSTIYLFSTHLGILTQHELIIKNTGGFLITKIFLN
jgi:hypothetical protein